MIHCGHSKGNLVPKTYLYILSSSLPALVSFYVSSETWTTPNAGTIGTHTHMIIAGFLLHLWKRHIMLKIQNGHNLDQHMQLQCMFSLFTTTQPKTNVQAICCLGGNLRWFTIATARLSSATFNDILLFFVHLLLICSPNMVFVCYCL